VLQELRVTVTTATELVAEIGDRFNTGDAAPELTARLAALVATLELQLARVGTVPAELQTDIAGLLALVRTTTMTGGRWLDAAAEVPELAVSHMRARLQKLYGASVRDDSPP
jgi:hypothetical protein